MKNSNLSRIVALFCVCLFVGSALASASGWVEVPAPPRGGEPQSSETFKVSIQNFAFQPSEIRVKVGDTIIWTNFDDTIHTVTFNAEHDSRDIAPGDSYSIQFNAESVGKLLYYCRYHGSLEGGMQGFVSVVEDTTSTGEPGSTPETSGFGVSISRAGFDPAQLKVPVGSTVVWTNNDPEQRHSIKFNDGVVSEPIPPGTSYKRVFDTVGTYTYTFAALDFRTTDIRGVIAVYDSTGGTTDGGSTGDTGTTTDETECRRLYEEADARFRSEVLAAQETRHKEYHQTSEFGTPEDEAFHMQLRQEAADRRPEYFSEFNAKCGGEHSQTGDSGTGTSAGGECDTLRAQAEENLRQYMVNVDARRSQFSADLEAEHKTYDAEAHTEEEHAALHADLRNKGDSFGARLETEIRDTRQSYFKEFFERCASDGSTTDPSGSFGSECNTLREQGENSFRDYLAGVDSRRREFFEAQQSRLKQFEAEAHTDEERAAFHYQLRAEAADFESALQNEVAAHKDSFFKEFNARCGGHEVYATGAGGEEFRNECSQLRSTAEENFAAIIQNADRKRKEFAASMEERRMAFESENHTAEEKETFFVEWRRLIEEFQGGLQVEVEGRRAETFRDFEAKCGAFQESFGGPGQFGQPGMPPEGAFGGHYEESKECVSLREGSRLEFDGLHRDQETARRAFYERQGTEKREFFAVERSDEEIRVFASTQERARADLETSLQEAMRALETKIRKAFEEKCGASQMAQGGEMQHFGPPPECIEFFKNMEANGFAFERERRAAHEAFEERVETLFDQLQNPDLTDEERLAIKQRIDEAKVAFAEAEDKAVQAFKASMAFPEKCRPPGDFGSGQVGETACGGENIYMSTRAFEDKSKETRARMESSIREKAAAFAKSLDERERAFVAANHTEDEIHAFHLNQEKARADFEETVRHEFADLEKRLRAAVDSFRADASEGCFGSDVRNATAFDRPTERKEIRPPPRTDQKFEEFKACGEGSGDGRLEFELQVRLKIKEFENEQLKAKLDYLQSGERSPEDLAAFDKLQEQERRAFFETLKEDQLKLEGSIRSSYMKCKEVATKDARQHERLGNFEMTFDESAGSVSVAGKFVSLTGDEATELITEYSVGGQLFLDAVSTTAAFSDFGTDTNPEGVSMRISGEGFSYNVHDNPVGLWKFHSTEGVQVKVDFADYLAIEDKDGTLALTDGNVTAKFIVRSGEYKLDGDVLTFEGEAIFLVKAKREVLDKVANTATDELDRAVERGTLGAEVTFVRKDDSSRIHETLSYEELKVTVESPKDDKGVSVRVSSEEEKGKVVVLNVDKSIVEGANAVVKLFDVTTGSETEVRITKAASLTALLAASGTESQYWIVTDEDGVQVLVYVGRFSEKRIDVQSAEEEEQKEQQQTPAKSPIPGFEPLVLLGALLLTGLAARRRKIGP